MRIAILSRFQFLALLVVVMPLFSYPRSTHFEVRASYRSAANPARQYDIQTVGAYPPGADMADAYRGRIVVTIGSVRYQLTVNAERFTPRLNTIEPPEGLAPAAGQVIDAALLAQFILAIDLTASREQVHEEARELFAVLQAAGMGPKIGLPDTQGLELVSVSSDYQ